MRRRTPVLLIAAGIILALNAYADIPTRTARVPSLAESVSRMHGGALEEFSSPMDPHPFATEFYLHEFATESEKSSHSHPWYSPVVSPMTNAASSLSKRMASLRRALVRMMP